MVRHEDWPLRLSTYLRQRKATPFAWGENDCVLFAADAVLAMTGVDVCAEYRGYASEAEAEALMGGKSLKDLVSEKLGMPFGNYLSARRGDVVLTEFNALGVVDDSGQKVAVVTPEGLRRAPLTCALYVWRV